MSPPLPNPKEKTLALVLSCISQTTSSSKFNIAVPSDERLFISFDFSLATASDPEKNSTWTGICPMAVTTPMSGFTIFSNLSKCFARFEPTKRAVCDLKSKYNIFEPADGAPPCRTQTQNRHRKAYLAIIAFLAFSHVISASQHNRNRFFGGRFANGACDADYFRPESPDCPFCQHHQC